MSSVRLSLPALPQSDSSLFVAQPPGQHLRLSVVIPAKDEAENLPFALDALRIQQQLTGEPMPYPQYEVLLLLNNCTDNSAAVAERYQARYPAFPMRVAVVQLPPERANVGTARRMLMDVAQSRLQQTGQPTGVIASTDADTVVDRHWMAHILSEIDGGCDMVGGRILTRSDGRAVRLNYLRDCTYRMLIARLEDQLDPLPHDPWPRHFQHFGANMAITCTAYEQIGGLPNVPHLEDEALYRALLRTDGRIRKSPLVRVVTSTRTTGRAEIGFSEQLRYWEGINQLRQCQLVEPAGAIYRRLQSRRQLRLLWQNRAGGVLHSALAPVADALLLDTDWLREHVMKATYFGQLWEQVENQLVTGTWADAWPPTPIETAIATLRLLLRS